MDVFQTFAHGKLLLTGEYAVLDGALSLAIPVRFGQALRAEKVNSPSSNLYWTSRDHLGNTWFIGEFTIPELQIVHTSDVRTAQVLLNMLASCQQQNPEFLAGDHTWKVETALDFPQNWGLGTSSSLIAALARWAKADPYRILQDTLGGSGYDLACAYAEGPILYRLEGQKREITPVEFQPGFLSKLYFIYLGVKQDSRAGMQHYRDHAAVHPDLPAVISGFTRDALNAQILEEFEDIIWEHEGLLAEVLNLPTVRERFFRDYWGTVKSLGAWGGDFILATSARSAEETRTYFNDRGFQVFMPYANMALQ